MLPETKQILSELKEVGRIHMVINHDSGVVQVFVSHAGGITSHKFAEATRPTFGAVDDLDCVAMCPDLDIPLALLTGKVPHHYGGHLQFGVDSTAWQQVLAPILMHRLLRDKE